MAYRRRLPLLVLLDSIIVIFSIFVGYFILNPYMDIYTVPMVWISSITLLCSHHLFASIYRLYQKAWEYASIGELLAIAKAVTFSAVTTSLVQLLINHDIYFRVLGLTWMMHIIFIGGSRFSWRVLRDRYVTSSPNKKRTLIIGAGSAGTMIARQLLKSTNTDLYPVAFVDDDPKKLKLQIYNIKVVGDTSEIPNLVATMSIENIVIAIPSLKRKQLKRIYEQCAKTGANTKTMPMIEDLASGNVSINQIRDVEVEDLLGREPIELDLSTISKQLTGKTVLVTGAGGSIGSEICRQICKFNPDKLLLLGHGENSIYSIDMELRNKYCDTINFIPLIADVQDRVRIFDVMSEYKPDVVYHAAAHKHVPLMEYNPMEAVKNNIFGTKNVAEAADAFGVKSFVMISTDKAVNPPNVMGATKRIAEMIIQNLARESQTNFVAVRFGNVLGSRGSVIPLFKKQIQAGGPVTVTHPDMTRYFMTIPEASRLVIQAGSLARGGEIFVLDMGEPVKIVDLAQNLITLSGYSIEDIGIEFSGIRPGEKMYEELLNKYEVHPEQVFPKIHIGKAAVVDDPIFYEFIASLIDKDNVTLKKLLVEIANTKDGLKEVMREAVSFS
ncbi:NDP-sugar epimerase, includes UDP-GlcNAc-inverting 4,6-dehydratase FlaA1 and capsular polysaccharide biosynthesis protein EpsC [Bacillus sp. OV322]|uniref:polysaccharide biosynthesis protein n=1 Tax=Bacillus sp. OV322 TaxID=1882764 RepID=UPI0008E68D9F|nr:nucleoside-diphosphate sugar epimerase/dehydratase [Bacillus sp. OV322]SFC52664.1 NDP-sugar epimerase, includes UDP-GlcNAc-inverting 4,6-dehydratase FlaA1 and capsular polysaccharide biosynthesis protein EpsC [Bacillus sp. OV322]